MTVRSPSLSFSFDLHNTTTFFKIYLFKKKNLTWDLMTTSLRLNNCLTINNYNDRSAWSYRPRKPNVTYLNDSGHLLREDIKQFDLSWNTGAIFSMSKQGKSEKQNRENLSAFLLLSLQTGIAMVVLFFFKCWRLLKEGSLPRNVNGCGQNFDIFNVMQSKTPPSQTTVSNVTSVHNFFI